MFKLKKIGFLARKMGLIDFGGRKGEYSMGKTNGFTKQWDLGLGCHCSHQPSWTFSQSFSSVSSIPVGIAINVVAEVKSSSAIYFYSYSWVQRITQQNKSNRNDCINYS